LGIIINKYIIKINYWNKFVNMIFVYILNLCKVNILSKNLKFAKILKILLFIYKKLYHNEQIKRRIGLTRNPLRFILFNQFRF